MHSESIIKNYMGIEGLLLYTPKIFIDDRGSFCESFNKKKFEKVVGHDLNFVQDNQSVSARAVLRGFHLQRKPFSQGKLVRVLSGEIFDVAIDLRPNSTTYLRAAYVNLSYDNFKQFWIPEGFAHGFLSLQENTQVLYKTTDYFSTEHDVTINVNEFDIPWPNLNVDFLLSQKDLKGITLDYYEKNF
jgi:dTDP-4-dehydrorhamnose 3,5-epimerase